MTQSKALFLDRDGTINVEKNYLYKIEDFEFMDGIIELCQKAVEKGYLIIVITNQSGIARGYYTLKDYEILTDFMINEFKKHGVPITEVFFCPHLDGPDRKPNPGMFLKAKEKYNIDMAFSVALGDKERDREAAASAGVRTLLKLDEKTDKTKNNIASPLEAIAYL